MKATDLLHLPGITAFSTLRDTGSPHLPYSGFSTCSYTGDLPQHYGDCRNELASSLGIEPDNIVFPRQTHSLNVAVVRDPAVALTETDALVTDRHGIALGIHTADCVPLVLADIKAGVIGAAHSGWRGAAGNIAALTVEKMVSLGADPANIHAAMGPCICPECFEVGEEVAAQFEQFGAVVRTSGKPHVNLPKAITASLVNSGVPRQNIAAPCGCSRCDWKHFFSARRLGVESGRTLTLIILR